MRVTVKSVIIVLLSLTLFSCKKTAENRIVIWSSSSEFVQYVEYFNKTHKNTKAVLVYKDNPANSLPPAKDETTPDIIVGPWLRNNDTTKYFKSLQYMFDRKNLKEEAFYPQLLEAGKVHKKNYLLPLCFNLPVVIFSGENEKYVTNDYMLSLDEIKEIAGEFNKKIKGGRYTAMGFSPLNSNDFLYQVVKIYGADFHAENNSKITYNEQNLLKAVDYLKDWITSKNTSAADEQDFAYRYLFMPDYRQVTSGKTLFSYTTTDRLFKILRDQDINIDFRWIVNNNSIQIEDSLMMMGIYRKTKKQSAATEFVSWLLDAANQKELLQRKINLDLNTEMFGISGGFSSIIEVTEHVLPLNYTQLLTNLPPAQLLTVPQKLPARWENYKSIVLVPYIQSVITGQEGDEILEISELEKELKKKVFD